jgi:dTDP-4-amino-4,6-dideoxygalactose transaminase
MFKPISISLSPNVQGDDVWLAIKLVVKAIGLLLTSPPSPLSLRRRGGIEGGVVTATAQLEQKFKEYLGAKHAFSFNSGRSALYTIMKALDIKEGDEVLLQAFTCNAVPNPVLWAGGTPIYVDIDNTLNIDPAGLEKKVQQSRAGGGNPRAVIIQNTFGIPAQIDRIVEIARRHNLTVIEDCAHALGALRQAPGKPQKVGTFGDVAFFSFGRDKVISSVWGGMITTNDDALARKIGNIHRNSPIPSLSWTLKQLLHPILFAVIIPTYYVFGKYLLAFLRVVRGVGLAVSQKERIGERPNMFPASMPDALAELALHQFSKLEKYNAHRRKIAKIYFQELNTSPPFTPPLLNKERGLGGEVIPTYLRFNIRHPRAKEIIRTAKRKRILLGDWYKNVIDPIGTDFAKMKYVPGSCPRAEKAAHESINLPTHINISQNDARRIIQYIRDYR